MNDNLLLNNTSHQLLSREYRSEKKRKNNIKPNKKTDLVLFDLKIETFIGLLCIFFSRYPSRIFVHLFRAFFFPISKVHFRVSFTNVLGYTL